MPLRCYKEVHKKVQKSFIYLWMMIGFSYMFYLTSAYLFSPQFVSYAWQYVAVNFIIHFHCFQILIFTRGVEERLRNLRELSGTEISSLSPDDIKTGLIHVHDIVQEINKCFGSSLLITYFWLYGSILSNLHWIGISLIGVPFASIEGICSNLYCFLYRSDSIKLSKFT